MKQLRNINSEQLNSLNIYYGNLDNLIINFITPLMDTFAQSPEFWFWERSCIGGKHLKVRFLKKTEADLAIEETILHAFTEFQTKNPSKTKPVYNEAATIRLIECEKRYVSEEELKIKHDCAVSMPYERKADEDATEELLEIMHNFLADTREFCTKIISSDIDRKLICLRLMAVFAVEQFGSLENGSIMFRAHWDNYENWFKPEHLPLKIKEHYRLNKPALHKVVQEIMDQHTNNELIKNPLYVEWINILRTYRFLVYQRQKEDIVFMPGATTPEGVVATLNHLNEQKTDTRSEKFLRHLYSEPNYLGSLSTNKNLQMTRIMANLSYHVFSNLGISAFQRMSFCYFLHRSVEDILGIDILDLLDEKMKTSLNLGMYNGNSGLDAVDIS